MFSKYLFKVIIYFYLMVNIGYAQWQPNVRLTNDISISATSGPNARNIAASGNYLHVVWFDNRDGNYEIYYKRSSDNGLNWGSDTRLTFDTAVSKNPSVSVANSFVHVVWEDFRNGYDIYYKRSTNNGLNWDSDIQLNNYSGGPRREPSISANGLFIHVVWHDFREIGSEIYYKRSSNGGVNWSPDTRITDISEFTKIQTCVCVFGTNVHVTWRGDRSENEDIFYKHSTDGGLNWSPDFRITYVQAHQSNPSIAVSGATVHIVWWGWNVPPTFGYGIYYIRSTNDGISWETETNLNFPDYSTSPTIAASGLAVHIVTKGNGATELFYKNSTNGGVSWSSLVGLTNDPGYKFNPSIAVSDSVVNVVWQDNRDGNDEIYYTRNPTGNIIGILNNNPEIPNNFLLKQNYPNPFNPVTNIVYNLPVDAEVSLRIYNLLGQEVKTLVNGMQNKGRYEVLLNGTKLASGMYIYVMEANTESGSNFREVKKMVLVK